MAKLVAAQDLGSCIYLWGFKSPLPHILIKYKIYSFNFMINRIIESTLFPTLKIGDTIKVAFKGEDLKNTKLDFIEGQIIRIHKNNNNFFITINSLILGVNIIFTFLLNINLINNIEIIKNKNYHKSKLYFITRLKNN